MNDETPAGGERGDPPAERDTPVENGDSPTGQETQDTETRDGTVRRYVDYVLLGGFLLLAGVAAISLYLSAGQVITDWVAPEFRSLFRTAFNLVVLLAVGVGISWQLRRVR